MATLHQLCGYNIMNKLIVFIVCLFLCAGGAHADISCKTNSIGTTVCRDSNTGTRIRGRASSSGRTKYSTSDGKIITARQTATGTTIYTDNQGSRTKCRKNALGNTVCTDNVGDKLTCRTNALSKTVCK